MDSDLICFSLSECIPLFTERYVGLFLRNLSDREIWLENRLSGTYVTLGTRTEKELSMPSMCEIVESGVTTLETDYKLFQKFFTIFRISEKKDCDL